MKKILLFIISLIPVLFSCTKDEIKIDPDNLLTGIWNYSVYQDNSDVFTRSNEFINDHCYQFNADGTLLERKNSGWCGTPPVSYADYAGTWTLLNDTLINVVVGYWGGTTTYMLDVESVTENSLKVIYIPSAK
jgi:hypothetical protein